MTKIHDFRAPFLITRSIPLVCIPRRKTRVTSTLYTIQSTTRNRIYALKNTHEKYCNYNIYFNNMVGWLVRCRDVHMMYDVCVCVDALCPRSLPSVSPPPPNQKWDGGGAGRLASVSISVTRRIWTKVHTAGDGAGGGGGEARRGSFTNHIYHKGCRV